MLPLDSPTWFGLSHAYGPAVDTPDLLRQLDSLPPCVDYIPDWSASARRDSVVSNPSWPQVDSAIRALNNVNDLYLIPSASDSETCMAVGGGAGRYILTGSIKNASFPTLVDAARDPTPQATLVVGGQVGDFPANRVVDLESAIETAKAFVSAGGFHTDTSWTYL